jgi:hypothetical protein
MIETEKLVIMKKQKKDWSAIDYNTAKSLMIKDPSVLTEDGKEKLKEAMKKHSPGIYARKHDIDDYINRTVDKASKDPKVIRASKSFERSILEKEERYKSSVEYHRNKPDEAEDKLKKQSAEFIRLHESANLGRGGKIKVKESVIEENKKENEEEIKKKKNETSFNPGM